jgi:hypothetical protein
MWNKSFLSGLLLVTLGSGCGFGSCPDYEPVSLASGNYKGLVSDQRSGQILSVEKRIVIDRAAGTATISFVRDGKQVVETWKLSPDN